MKEITMLIIFIAISGCSTVGQAVYDWQTKYPDNQIEEAVERFIEDKTDFDLDLTPITGDEKQKLN